MTPLCEQGRGDVVVVGEELLIFLVVVRMASLSPSRVVILRNYEESMPCSQRGVIFNFSGSA